MTPPIPSDILRLDAIELVRRLKARELSCVELMEATLDRDPQRLRSSSHGRRLERRRDGRAGAAHTRTRGRLRLRRQPAQPGRVERRLRPPPVDRAGSERWPGNLAADDDGQRTDGAQPCGSCSPALDDGGLRSGRTAFARWRWKRVRCSPQPSREGPPHRVGRRLERRFPLRGRGAQGLRAGVERIRAPGLHRRACCS